jgi:O-succinylbenzoic acid--CoA ligase
MAMPDERLGHVIHFISDPTLEQIQSHHLIQSFNDQVLGFEKIRQWRVMDVIPRTELGKLKIFVDRL